MIRGSNFAATEGCLVTARAPLWSQEEIVITVYFLSRQIRPRTLHYLLLRRGYDRSARAIERKLFSIIQQHPHLRRSEGHWDLDSVDSWIDDLLGDHDLVNTLIHFSPEDAQDVALVSRPVGMNINLSLLSTAQNRINKLTTLWNCSIFAAWIYKNIIP
jgi:hypothetical protein